MEFFLHNDVLVVRQLAQKTPLPLRRYRLEKNTDNVKNVKREIKAGGGNLERQKKVIKRKEKEGEGSEIADFSLDTFLIFTPPT